MSADAGAAAGATAGAAAAAPRIEVDRSVCCGAGMCTLTVPEVFDQDEADGLVLVLLPEPPARTHDAVRMAVRLCPCSAISFREA